MQAYMPKIANNRTDTKACIPYSHASMHKRRIPGCLYTRPNC